VLEDAGAQSISNWATAISAGPANESGQALTFTLTTDNAALFASAPAVNSVGTLSFTSAPNVYGSATVTVTLADGGGTANGGVNTSASQTFQITSVPVNDAPSFTAGANQAVNEDAAAQAVAGWAASISSGPNEPGQVLTFTTTAGNPLLFSVQPAVAANGDLSYTPAANAYGSTTVTVTLHDDGGTANSGSDTSAPQTFVITLNPVNDVPSFTAGSNRTVSEDAGAQTVAAWATAISAGPLNEASQALTFTLTTDNVTLFGVLPAVSATTGNLTFTPAANQFGTATVTATLQDSGGTDRGGVDTSVAQVFTLTVDSVNDAPSFGKGPNLNVITSTLQTFNGWATTIKPGPTNENGQVVDFIVTTNNAALFEIPPAISPLGTLTFKPTPHFNGSALVTVLLHDDGGTANGGVDTSAAQTFTIDVSASPDAPINIVPGQQETNLSTALFFSTSTGNYLAVYDDDAIQFNEQMSLTLSVGNGTLTLASTTGLTLTTGSSGAIVQFTGSITDVNANLNDLRFDPTPGFFGVTTLVMTTEDLGHPGELETFSDSDPVNIRVNAPPVAVDDAYNGPQGSALIVPAATGVLANDVALNARPITATLLSGPASGQLVLAADGSFVYIPTPTFSGLVTFTYQANDRGLISNAALVTVSVMFINQAPTFSLGFNPAVNEDSSAQTVLNFMTNVTPGPSNETGQTLTLTVTAATPTLFAAQPTLDMGTGTLTYTPAANAFGSTAVTVTLADNGGTANGGVDTATKVFTITLNAVNDVPAFAKGANQTVRIDSGPQLVAGWASGISTGPANESTQTLTFNVATSNNALFAILPSIDPTSGDLSFTSAPSIFGSATVTVTLQDNGGTANGGVDTSAPQAFVIVVQPYRLFLPLISRN
nr:tandem-95 repeat protein [Thermoflexales bacterium]